MELTMSAQELFNLLIDQYEEKLEEEITPEEADLLVQKTNRLVEISGRLAKGLSTKEDLQFTMEEAFSSGLLPQADKVVHWKRE